MNEPKEKTEEGELTDEEKEVIAQLEDVMRQANELEKEYPGIIFGEKIPEEEEDQ